MPFEIFFFQVKAYFLGKKNENIITLSSAEFAKTVVNNIQLLFTNTASGLGETTKLQFSG